MEIIFIVLKIIGFIFALFLSIIIFLFLAPIKYQLTAEKEETLFVSFKSNCFFGLIKIFVKFEGGEVKHKIIIFPLSLFKRKKKKQKKKVEEKENNTLIVEKESNIIENEKTIEEERLNPEQKVSLIDKIKNFINEAKRMYTIFVEFPNKKEIINYTLKLIKEFLKVLIPNKHNINIKIGLEDPSQTAYILGLIYTIRPFTGLNINAIGDFEEKVLMGKVFIKDSFNLFQVSIPLVKYIIKKPIRELIIKTLF